MIQKKSNMQDGHQTNEPSNIPLLREIDWVRASTGHSVTEGEAAAIVDLRKITVELRFLRVADQWELSIFRATELLLKKTSTFHHRDGVSSNVWHFINPNEKIPWARIHRGEIWRTSNAILNYHFWKRCEIDVLREDRELLFLEGANSLLH